MPLRSSSRITYSPKAFSKRLLVGFRIRNKIDSSKIISLPYNVAYKYSIIFLLILIAALFSPKFIPRWVGFEWAAPEDLCQAPEEKLLQINHQLRSLTRLDSAEQFLEKQHRALSCMNASANGFYHGVQRNPPRYLWPNECDSEKAKTSLKETVCVSQETNVCRAVGGFLGFLVSIGGSCEKKIGPDVCTETSDENRAKALLALQQERDSGLSSNLTVSETEPITNTANSKIHKILSRLIFQVDIAVDAYILYSIMSVAVGIPLVIYSREKGSRIVGATFGLTKVWFVVIFIVSLSIYDSAAIILKESDFAYLFENFLHDPCYLDPHFSSKRASLIVDACNNISYISKQSDQVLQKMDAVYYDTRLFGHCKDESRELSVHPELRAMDKLRKDYRSGSIHNPGVCNATTLNELTSIPLSSDKVSRWKALLGSGIIAQLALKFIVTSWVCHVFSYLEPMVLHNGKVEVWNVDDGNDLQEDEREAVCRFVRDKNLLSLIIFTVLMVVEIAVILYSIGVTIYGGSNITMLSEPLSSFKPAVIQTCPKSLFSL